MSLSVAAMRPSVRSSSPSRQAPRSTSPRCVEPWCPASPSGWCPSQGLAGALTACHWLAGWGWRASEIGGIALSTTSLAVVYAVVEMGLSGSAVGQLLLSATFVTDLATLTALSLLFLTPTWWLVPFVAVSALRHS